MKLIQYLLLCRSQNLINNFGVVKTRCWNAFLLHSNLFEHGLTFSSEQSESDSFGFNFKAFAILNRVVVWPYPFSTFSCYRANVVSFMRILNERDRSLLIQRFEVGCRHVVSFDSFGTTTSVSSKLDVFSWTQEFVLKLVTRTYLRGVLLCLGRPLRRPKEGVFCEPVAEIIIAKVKWLHRLSRRNLCV
jgi:hypothetical protein